MDTKANNIFKSWKMIYNGVVMMLETSTKVIANTHIYVFTIMYIIELIYGALSIIDCRTPAIIAVVISSTGLLSISYTLCRRYRCVVTKDLDLKVKWYHWTSVGINIAAQSAILGLVDQDCRYTCHLQYIAVVMILFLVVISVVNIFINIAEAGEESRSVINATPRLSPIFEA
jgi:hypothetical protein